MILRPTKIEDISRVIDIINQAKTYFKNNDIDQWQDGYPNEETIEKDIENNEAYVLEEDGVILGTCMVRKMDFKLSLYMCTSHCC